MDPPDAEGMGGAAASDTTGLDADVALGVLRTLDRWYIEIQDVARSAGLLSSGRESLDESEDESGDHYIHFPDLADEGWPRFSMAVPRDGVFSHATSGVFYRGVQYTSALRPDELLVAYKGFLTELGVEYEARDDHLEDYLRTSAFGGDVRIRIRPDEAGSRVAIGQYRAPSAVRRALHGVARYLGRNTDDPR